MELPGAPTPPGVGGAGRLQSKRDTWFLFERPTQTRASGPPRTNPPRPLPETLEGKVGTAQSLKTGLEPPIIFYERK